MDPRPVFDSELMELLGEPSWKHYVETPTTWESWANIKHEYLIIELRVESFGNENRLADGMYWVLCECEHGCRIHADTFYDACDQAEMHVREFHEDT